MTENTTPEPASISIADIRNLLAIIDAAAKRGAFNTKEFGAIYEAYTKVENFVNSQDPKTEETQGA